MNYAMRKRLLYLSFLLIVCVYNNLYAQTTYKRVTLDRGKDPETNCIYIINDNADSVMVFIQYKVGNRHTEWIDYPVPQLIPPTILDPQLIGCVDSTIIGLNLLDVIIVKSKTQIDVENNKFQNGNEKKEGLYHKIKSWFSKD